MKHFLNSGEVEAAIQRGEKVRIVLVFEGFDELSGGALWQDLKLSVERLTHWERIALVTDIDWMIHLTALFGWMTPADLEHSPMAERMDENGRCQGSSWTMSSRWPRLRRVRRRLLGPLDFEDLQKAAGVLELGTSAAEREHPCRTAGQTWPATAPCGRW